MPEETPRLFVGSRRPGTTARPDDAHGLRFHVLYTRMPNTARAMSRATEIASEVSASITILALRTVSYPRPLDEPPMSIYFLRRTLWRFACGADVEIYLCRDIHDALRQVLAPHSTVFLGGARWRFARERRLARTLLRGGHAAFLIDSPARFPYVDE